MRDEMGERTGMDDGPSAMREAATRIPALQLGRAADWRRDSSLSGAARGEVADDFDIGQMSARALRGLSTLLTGAPNTSAEHLEAC